MKTKTFSAFDALFHHLDMVDQHRDLFYFPDGPGDREKRFVFTYSDEDPAERSILGMVSTVHRDTDHINPRPIDEIVEQVKELKKSPPEAEEVFDRLVSILKKKGFTGGTLDVDPMYRMVSVLFYDPEGTPSLEDPIYQDILIRFDG